MEKYPQVSLLDAILHNLQYNLPLVADLEYRIPSNRLSKIKRFGTRGMERGFAVVGKRDGWEQTGGTYRVR